MAREKKFILTTNLKHVMGAHPEFRSRVERVFADCERVWRVFESEPAPVSVSDMTVSPDVTVDGELFSVEDGAREVLGAMPSGRMPRLRSESLARNHNSEKTQEGLDRLLRELQRGG